MVWLHYTSNKINSVKTDFVQAHPIKPCGLWCSYGNEWFNWCKDNGFYTFDSDNYYLYEITLNSNIKLLTVSSFDEYTKILGYGKNLDWDKVKNDYDGVAFLNYQEIKKDMVKNNVFDTLIYSLDISCCCIWNPVYDIKCIDHITD
jgi:hypothetical protein